MAQGKSLHIFPVREAVLWNMFWRIENLGDRTYKAKNPEFGAYINFSINQDTSDPVVVEIKDSKGNIVTTLEHKEAKKGVNRLVWDLGYDGAKELKNKIEEGFSYGTLRPKVPPGNYVATINAMNQTTKTNITVSADPRINMSLANYAKKAAALLTLRDLLSETHEFIDKVSDVSHQIATLLEKYQTHDLGDHTSLEKLHKNITAFKDEHMMRPSPSMNYRQRPRLREEIRSLMRAIDNTTNPPTQPQQERIISLDAELKQHEQMWKDTEMEIQKINTANESIPQIIINP